MKSVDQAHNWHTQFAQTDPHVTERSLEQFRILAQGHQIVVAKTALGDYVGTAYFDRRDNEWVLGGFACDIEFRRRGVGETLAYLVFGHLLVRTAPLSRGQNVVCYVALSNNGPRPLLEAFGFSVVGQVANDNAPMEIGNNVDDESDDAALFDKFRFSDTEKLKDVAQWYRNWKGLLRDETPAVIDLGDSHSFEEWHEALMEMAKTGKSS